MMKFKKFLAAAMTGVMMFGMVTTAVPAVNTYAAGTTDSGTADANTVKDGKNIHLEVDYLAYTATVWTDGDDEFLFLDLIKTSSSGEKVTGTYCYPVVGKGYVTIDLSFLNPKKEQKIRVYGNVAMENDCAEVTLAAQPTKLKLKYKYDSAATDWYGHFKNGNDAVTATTSKDYVYRTLYGIDWMPFSDFSSELENASIAGTTIIVREQPTDKDGIVSKPASAEVKIKISASAKAPKLKIDYTKGTINVTGKQEYFVVTSGSAVTTASGGAISYTQPADTVKSLNINTINPQNVEARIGVRTKAKGSKAASAIAFLSIPATPTLVDDGSKVVVNGNATKSLTYTLEDGKLVLKGDGFEYLKGTGDSAKWTKTKGGKGVTIDATSASVRSAGDKATSTLPSVPVTITGSTPKAAAPTAGENGAVKLGDAVVLTIARDTTTNTTINFATATGKGEEVKTLEYRVGNSGDFQAIPTDGKLPDQATTAITIQVRVKKTDNATESDPLLVTIAAVSAN